MHTTKKGLIFERPAIHSVGPAIAVKWEGENKLVINGGGRVELVGIVRGASYMNEADPIYHVSAPNIEQLVSEIIIPEWIYKLFINGRRIMNPERYLKRKGVLQ